MQVRTFTAASMPDAMALVRAEMGDDAVILSSQRGKRGIEVRAAAERKPAPILEDIDPAFSRLAVLEAELERRLIAAVATERAKPNPATPAWTPEAIAKRLAFHEVPMKLVEKLGLAAAKFGTGDGATALGQAIDLHIAFEPLPPIPETPIVLIGAPGAGKTASVAKLAVRAVLAGKPAALISTDPGAGAASQIEAFAQLIRMPVKIVEEPEELDATVSRLTAEDPERAILIDTPGINPFDRSEVTMLREIVQAAGGEPVLVTTAQGGGDLEEQALLFKALGARRLIATRFDLTRRLGGLLNAASSAGLAFAQGSSSPYIAETLEPMNPFALARRLLTDQIGSPLLGDSP